MKLQIKVKGKVLLHSAASRMCVTDRAVMQPKPQPKPSLTDVGLQPCSRA